jgi:hypothetical protein
MLCERIDDFFLSSSRSWNTSRGFLWLRFVISSNFLFFWNFLCFFGFLFNRNFCTGFSIKLIFSLSVFLCWICLLIIWISISVLRFSTPFLQLLLTLILCIFFFRLCCLLGFFLLSLFLLWTSCFIWRYTSLIRISCYISRIKPLFLHGIIIA